jgi:hypothetical protein
MGSGGKVVVRVERFIGHGAHVHVSMREEAAGGAAAGNRPAPGIRGRERYMKFRSPQRALQWVEATFRSDFDPERQELVFAAESTRHWFYGEGD